MRKLITVVATLALLIPNAATAQDETPTVTVVPDPLFCSLVADDIQTCEETLQTLASVGMVPASLAGLVAGAPAAESAPQAIEDVPSGTEDSFSEGSEAGISQVRGGLRITLEKMDWHPDTSGSLFRPDKGHKHVGALFTFEALTGTQSYNVWWWNAEDRDGHTYESIVYTVIEPGLIAGDIREGRKAKGWVTFEVPENVDWLELVELRPEVPELVWTVSE